MAKKLIEIKALNAISHNGVDYMPDDVLTLEQTDADRLIDIGAARLNK